MIKITKINYKDNHVAVELDSNEVLKISLAIIGQYDLKTGEEISPDKYMQLRTESDRYLCKRNALNYLAIRMRSGFEMEQYLKKKGYSIDIIRETTNSLKEGNYINDFDFALQYIKSRTGKKIVGKNLLISELYRKGITKKIIHRAVKESKADEIDVEEVMNMALIKYSKIKNKKNWQSKVSMFLQGRGFDFDIIKKAVSYIKEDIKDHEDGE